MKDKKIKLVLYFSIFLFSVFLFLVLLSGIFRKPQIKTPDNDWSYKIENLCEGTIYLEETKLPNGNLGYYVKCVPKD